MDKSELADRHLWYLREYVETAFTEQSIRALRNLLISEYGDRYERDQQFYDKINELVVDSLEKAELEYKQIDFP